MMSSLSADLVATGVPRARLHDAWVDLWPLIKPAYDKSPFKPDLLAGLMAKDFQLWAVRANNTAVAGIVTRLLRVGTSGELQCHLYLVGGSQLSHWAPDFISKLRVWAKAEGCAAITGNGRRGWARIVARFGGVRIEDREDRPCWRLAL
jgi:hypothetical protein